MATATPRKSNSRKITPAPRADIPSSHWQQVAGAAARSLTQVKKAVVADASHLGQHASHLADVALVSSANALASGAKHVRQSRDYVKTHPWQGVAVAVAAGILLTAWLSRRHRDD